MTALYEMTKDLKDLYQLMDSFDAEETESDDSMALAIRDTLDGLQLQFDDKAVAIVKFSQALEGDTTAIDLEIKRLQDRKKRITKRKESLRDYLRMNMEATDINKIECPLFTITLAKGRDQVQIANESQIPDDYVRVKTEIKPDKVAIGKALKQGQAVPGAELITGPTSLRVK